MFAALAPFAVFGDDWGFTWIMMHIPLSGFVKESVGIGRNSWGWILLVTAYYGTVVGLLVALIISAGRRRR